MYSGRQRICPLEARHSPLNIVNQWGIALVFQKFRSPCDTQDHVRPEQTGRAAVGGSQQRFHDEPQQTAPGGVARQRGATPTDDSVRTRL
jgi:hypothetical protein